MSSIIADATLKVSALAAVELRLGDGQLDSSDALAVSRVACVADELVQRLRAASERVSRSAADADAPSAARDGAVDAMTTALTQCAALVVLSSRSPCDAALLRLARELVRQPLRCWHTKLTEAAAFCWVRCVCLRFGARPATFQMVHTRPCA